MQDSKGYIWTAGDMGVSRFDGYKFKNFTTQDGLPENTVLNIYEDRQERIWFSTITGKLSYYKNDSIHSLQCNAKLTNLINDRLPSNLYIDKGDTIWLGGSFNFIIKIPPNRKATDVEKLIIPGGPYIYHVDEQGFIFGGEASKQKSIISVYNSKFKKIFSVNTGIENKEKYVLRFFASQLEDHSYIVSLDENYFHFNLEVIKKAKKIEPVIINCLELKNNFILCTYKGAFFLSKENPGVLTEIKQLHNEIVTCAYADKEGGIWISTEGHGLFYIPFYDFKYYTPQNGIPESQISCIGSTDSAVILGHRDYKITTLSDTYIKTMSLYGKGKKHLGSPRVNSILNVNNKILISTTLEPFYLVNKTIQTASHIRLIGIRQMINSADDNIWGLGSFSINKYSSSEPFSELKRIDFKMRIDHIFEDSEGRLWLNGPSGIYNYYNDTLTKVGLSNKIYNTGTVSTAETMDKSIWIITRDNGVIIKKGSITLQLKEENGLASNMCRCIFVDSSSVWVGTNKGLSKITNGGKDKYVIENYYTSNGLLNNEINNIIKRKGKIWVSHNNGISIFNPELIKNNRIPPQTYILESSVNDSPSKNYKLDELAYNENNIVINFIGLSYKDITHPEYKYKLEGVNSDWITTKYTSARYSTIPAGTYTFKVYARNNDGYWSNQPETLTFTILPAWWKTWWFILVYIIIGTIIIFLIFRFRLNSIRKTESEREMLLNKISTVELQALRSQMNPHFVFNALNSIQYFITSNDPESSQKYLEKFASLIRYVLDNSKLSPIPLKTEIEALNLYMELESLRFKFNYKIIIDEDKPIDEIYIPSMLIQPYVENAIWHGLMHKNGIGDIKITFKINETLLKCIIEDNGIGRRKAAEIKLNSGKVLTHKSVGMSITKERLNIINKVNLSDLTVTITDLDNHLGENTGTRVEIDIPFN